MSIATKTGDDGSTALMYGRRLSKNDPRVWAYGTVDELNAALGWVRATVAAPFITEPVLAIQKELVALMGELALRPDDRDRYEKGGYPMIEMAMVDRLTAIIDDLEKNHEIRYEGWATPGATPASAALDLARTTCRRAERYVVALADSGQPVKPAILAYLNRLSDLCWLWARWIETKALPPPRRHKKPATLASLASPVAAIARPLHPGFALSIACNTPRRRRSLDRRLAKFPGGFPDRERQRRSGT